MIDKADHAQAYPCERCAGTGDGQHDPVEGTLTCEKCHGSGCASKPLEVTPEQRKALRETGALFFGASGRPEIRNADHTVCITLVDLLDALDAKDAKIATLLDERAHETTMEASKSREVKNYLLWVLYAYEKYQRRVCLTMKKVEELVGRPIEAIGFDDYDMSIEVRAKDGIPLTQDEQKKVGQALGLMVWSDNRSPRSLEMKNKQLLADLEAARVEIERLKASASTQTPAQ